MHDKPSLPIFYSCKKKETARQKTIIDIYRKYFSNTLPIDRQYWTMCASQTDDKGVFQPKSELGQMLSHNLITDNQFYGCDIQQNVIELNKIAKPNSHWFCQDFLQSMKMCKNFNPSIVNTDLLNLKSHASAKISEVLSFLVDCNIKDILVVCNIMLNNPHEITTKPIDLLLREADSFIPLLEKNQSFCYAWGSGRVKMHPEMYIYNGSGAKSRTYLASFMFVIK